MTNERVDWWNQYLQSDDPDHVVVQMDKEIERLRAALSEAIEGAEVIDPGVVVVAPWSKWWLEKTKKLIEGSGHEPKPQSVDVWPHCTSEPRDCPYIYCHSNLKCAKEPAVNPVTSGPHALTGKT